MNGKSVRIGVLTAGLFLGSSLLTSLLFGGDFGITQLCLGIGWGAMMGVAVYVVDRRHRRSRRRRGHPEPPRNATVHSLLDRLEPKVTQQCGRSCGQQGGTDKCIAPYCYQNPDTHARRRRHGGQASAS
jgi:predicted lipid-binding transport protein (Tim44 family)